MSNAPRFEVYPQMETGWNAAGPVDKPTGEYGWRFRAANGQISAVGGEGFTRREDAERAVRDLIYALEGVVPTLHFNEAGEQV